jgi:hypothetical protein
MVTFASSPALTATVLVTQVSKSKATDKKSASPRGRASEQKTFPEFRKKASVNWQLSE